jgi:hypothetical protein
LPKICHGKDFFIHRRDYFCIEAIFFARMEFFLQWKDIDCTAALIFVSEGFELRKGASQVYGKSICGVSPETISAMRRISRSRPKNMSESIGIIFLSL